jgi:L-aminopeptidase/D-esterase-like protein
VLDPATAQVVAGARTAQGKKLLDTRRALLRGQAPQPLLAGTNTTIGVVATDARLTKAQAIKLAQMAHDGLARSINPVHTLSDGDTIFALATGQANTHPGMMVLGTMAAQATAQAVLQAVLAARSLTIGALHLPSALGR